MQFFPYSPMPIPKAASGLIDSDRKAITSFWERVDKELEEGLSGAIGCYLFSIRAGRGELPWYVGLAQRQSFRKECFTDHKLKHYNSAIASRKGTPLLTLIPKFTKTEQYAKPSPNGHRDIVFLENMLIGTCLRRNPKLLNSRDTKLLREMVVHGLLNNPRGKNYSSVTEFKNLIGS